MNTYIKIPLFIVTLVILALVSGHFTFKLLSFSRTVDVPDLKGKTTTEANDIVRHKSLYLRMDGEDFDPNTPQGRIIRQDTPSGSKVKEGREIRIVVSKGPRFQYMPEVVGQTVAAAEAMLAEKGIKMGRVIYAHSEVSPKDVIIAQRPETGEKGGTEFKVVVSLGDYEEKLKQ